MTIEIANRLVQLRRQNHLSQEELAARLGISRQAVSKWERAEASPDTDNLILLSRLYGVSLDALLATDAGDDRLRQDEEENRESAERGADAAADSTGPSVAQAQAVEAGEAPAPVPGEEDPSRPSGWRRLLQGLMGCYPIVVTIVYLLLGFCLHAWHPGWLVFLTIPVFYVVAEAVLRRE